MSRAHFTYKQNISVTDLLLDTENARIRVGSDQNDCIARILRKEDQLLALMRDIAEKGFGFRHLDAEGKAKVIGAVSVIAGIGAGAGALGEAMKKKKKRNGIAVAKKI